MTPALSHHARHALDNVTTAAAAGAITSPVWLPWLQTASEIAALLAPIMGVVWLVVQIWTKLKSNKESTEKHD